MRTVLEEICGGHRNQEGVRQRGVESSSRPARGGLIPRSKLESRFESFVRGSRTCNAQAASIRQRRRRRSQDCVERRATRAEALVHMKRWRERNWFQGRHTLDALANLEPQVGFSLDGDLLSRNLRLAKRGSAGGPSGMIVEHLHPLLPFQGFTTLLPSSRCWPGHRCHIGD